jgi:hypothetical protein
MECKLYCLFDYPLESPTELLLGGEIDDLWRIMRAMPSIPET